VTLANCKTWRRDHPLAIAAPAAVLAVALYAITLRGTFIWDDRFIAQDDPRLHDASGWRAYLHAGYRPNAVDNLWRPLTSLTFWAQWRLTGGITWRLHAMNILLHAAVSALVAALAHRLAGARAGLIAGLLFAAHPLHVEAVAYLVGRAETLCAAGVVAALLVMARRPLTVGRAVGVFACAIVAACGKEQGLLTPVMLAGLWCLMLRPSMGPATAQERRAILTLVMLCTWAWAAYVLYRDRILPWYWDPYFLDWSINPLARATGLDRALMPVALVGRVATLLVFPWRLSPDYGLAVTTPAVNVRDPHFYLGVAAILLVLTLAARAWRRRDGFALFCALGLAVAWLPASNVLRIGTIFGERLTYLPSVFVLMWVARALSRAPTRWLAPGLSIVLVLMSIRTVTYAARWNDRLTFYERSLAEQPKSAQLHILVVDELQARARDAHARGAEMEARGYLLRSADVLAHAREVAPAYYKIWTESVETSHELGELDAAERFLERAEDLEPGAPAVGYWRTRLVDEQDRAKRGGTTTAPAIAAPQRGRLPGGAGTR